MGMAERIKERRNALGYTQEELATKLGLQKSAIAKYENGRVENIKRSVILKMAQLLECRPCYLMDMDDASISASSDTEPLQLTPEEKSHMETYRLLNQENQTKVVRYTNSLLDLQQQEEEPLLLAAHRRTGITDEEYEVGKEHDLELMEEMIKKQ